MTPHDRPRPTPTTDPADAEDERARLQAVHATGLLAAGGTDELADLPALAARLLGAPMAALSVLDEHRQVLLGAVGIADRETPRGSALCAHTIADRGLFEVADTLADPRFAGNPLVTGPPGIRSYAGVPVTGDDGHRLGALFVADRVPRTLDAADRDALQRLARQASRIVALRTAAARLARVGRTQDAAVAALGRAVDPERLDQAFAGLLADVLAISGSAYGFIGEVHEERAGQPMLRTHAITDIAWDAASRALYESTGVGGMAFRRLDTLFGHVMRSGEALYTDDAAGDPRRGGLPPGHPPLHAFVGLPVYSRGRMIGMLGLANRPQGYSPALARDLEPVLAAVAAMIEAARAERARRAADAAMRASEQMLRDLADTVHGAIVRYVAHPDGREEVPYLSAGAQAIWDVEPRILVEQPARLWETVHPDDADGLRDSIRHSVETLAPWRHQWRIRTPSGRTRVLSAIGNPRRGPQGEVDWTTHVVDVTERHAAEQALAVSEARFRAIAENIPGAIFRYLLQPDGHHRVEFISAGAKAIWEHEPAAIEADPLLLSAAMSGADRDRFRASLEHSAASLALWQERWQIITPSGRRKWLEGSGRPARRADGAVAWDGYVFDVTERREAEAALALSEARLRVLLESAPEAVVVLDVEAGRFVDFNGKACRLFDVDEATLHQLDPASTSPALQPDGRPSGEAAREYVQRAAAGEEPVFEWTHRRADGSPVACEVHLVRIPDAHRILVRGSVVDITARKAAEEALRRSEARLGLVVQNMLDGFFILDRAWRLVEVNESAARAMGGMPAAMLGRDLRELLPGVEQRAFGRAYASAMADGLSIVVSDFHPYLERWYEARVQPAGETIAVFFNDITDRKRAEQALRESERRFRSLVEDLPTIAVQGYDHERRITFWNRASEQLYGWTAAEAIGRRLEDTIIPTAMRDAVIRDHARWTRDGRIDQPSEEMVLVDRAGLPVPVYSSHVMQRHADGSAELYCLDVDLRDLRRTEAALQQANASLRQRNDELQQFVMVASHDLQEPLRKVQTFADRLQGSMADRVTPSERDLLDRLHGAASRMRELIQDLLDYSTVSFGAAQRVAVDLDAALRGVLEDLAEPIAASAARIESQGLGCIDADPVQMRQLLQNLIGNALKYRDPRRPPRVRVQLARVEAAGGPCWRLEVADNGIGFDPAHRERIFAPFQRLHARTAYEGTGIGLAIVRRIAERHGGTVAAQGRPGEGATFVVLLPLAGPSAREDVVQAR